MSAPEERDPSVAADAWWSAVEEARERELEEALCGGCRLCAVPGPDYPAAEACGIGWCLAYGCFVGRGDRAADYGCDDYEAA